MNYSKSDKQWFLKCLENKNLVEKIKEIKVIITDIDGALTDGQLSVASIHPLDNDSYSKLIGKNFSLQDGFITATSTKNNLISVAFLTGRSDKAAVIRAKMLGIPEDLCFIGVSQKKIEKVKTIQESKNFSIKETLYFGDDFLDFETKENVGIMTCPENAPFYFQEVADLVIPREGGKSPFRLLLDLVLFVQEKHFAQDFIQKSLEKNA